MTVFQPTNILLLCATLLVGCSSSSSTNDTPTNMTPDTASSLFADSDAVNERFGTLTSRNFEPIIDADTQSLVVDALNNFSLNLHRIVVNTAPEKGSIESGYSAAIALSLANAGTASSTQSALVNMLGVDDIAEPKLYSSLNAIALALNSRSNEDLLLRTANRIFVTPGLALQNDYLDIATADFGAPITEADFFGANEEVTRLVNGWVSEQTDNFIPSIIDSFSAQTVFALLNAIFLDATWQDEYRSMGKRDFNALNGTTVSVESFGGRSQLPLLRNDDLVALEIPYGGGEIAMLILMPASLADFESTLNALSVENVVNAMAETDVDFTAPNWKEAAGLNLAQLLAPLGVPANPWDFGRMIDGEAALDVIVKQKARIEVDENGTRAAAVTLVAGDASVPEFVNIDRPFAYVIRDRITGVILFTGRVVSPE